MRFSSVRFSAADRASLQHVLQFPDLDVPSKDVHILQGILHRTPAGAVLDPEQAAIDADQAHRLVL